MHVVGNRRTLFDFQANNVTGVPDGMTIDTDGNLWVACYDGGKVIFFIFQHLTSLTICIHHKHHYHKQGRRTL